MKKAICYFLAGFLAFTVITHALTGDFHPLWCIGAVSWFIIGRYFA